MKKFLLSSIFIAIFSVLVMSTSSVFADTVTCGSSAGNCGSGSTTTCVTSGTGFSCTCATDTGAATCSAVSKYDNLNTSGSTNSAASLAGSGGLNTTTSVPVIIGNVIKVILGISGTVALIFIIWGGIQWMISKGDPTKIGSARKLMTSGMIGIAIIAAAYAITDFVIKQITVIAG